MNVVPKLDSAGQQVARLAQVAHQIVCWEKPSLSSSIAVGCLLIGAICAIINIFGKTIIMAISTLILKTIFACIVFLVFTSNTKLMIRYRTYRRASAAVKAHYGKCARKWTRFS